MSELAGCSVVMVEDDMVLGRSIVQLLRLSGVVTYWAKNVVDGEALLRRHRPTMVLCDIRLPDGSGETLVARLMPELGGTPVVAMTAFSGVEQAVRLMRAGVDDYLPKPFEPQRLLDKLAVYASRTPHTGRPPDIVAGWRSPPMQALSAALKRVAPSPATVLLRGESGVGKGVAALRLHGLADPEAPFVVVDCAALPSALAEAEAVLFGREGVPGLLDGAAAGTLLLDEVADLTPPLQARLLGLAEDRSYTPVGTPEPRRLRARIIAASNADLGGLSTSGEFRQDLLFRLSVVELVVPPLRERPEDIADLAGHFVEHFSRALGERTKCFAEDAVDALLAHRWPGNVRELRNRIERAVLLAPTVDIGRSDLFPEPNQNRESELNAAAFQTEQAAIDMQDAAQEPASLAKARDVAEREHIRRVLARCRGRVGDAARVLGVSRTTLWDRMRRLGLSSR